MPYLIRVIVPFIKTFPLTLFPERTKTYTPAGHSAPWLVPSQPLLIFLVVNTLFPHLSNTENSFRLKMIPEGILKTSFSPSPFGVNAEGKKISLNTFIVTPLITEQPSAVRTHKL